MRALHNAAMQGDVADIRRLVASGVDVNALLDGGQTALHTAAFRGEVGAIMELVKLGANIKAKSKKQGYTALHMAVGEGHLVAAKTLVLLSADIEAKAAEGGHTPLHVAADKGNVKMLKTLVELSADIEAKSDDKGYEWPRHTHPSIIPFASVGCTAPQMEGIPASDSQCDSRCKIAPHLQMHHLLPRQIYAAALRGGQGARGGSADASAARRGHRVQGRVSSHAAARRGGRGARGGVEDAATAGRKCGCAYCHRRDTTWCQRPPRIPRGVAGVEASALRADGGDAR